MEDVIILLSNYSPQEYNIKFVHFTYFIIQVVVNVNMYLELYRWLWCTQSRICTCGLWF